MLWKGTVIEILTVCSDYAENVNTSLLDINDFHFLLGHDQFSTEDLSTGEFNTSIDGCAGVPGVY